MIEKLQFIHKEAEEENKSALEKKAIRVTSHLILNSVFFKPYKKRSEKGKNRAT